MGVFAKAFAEGLRPQELITVSEWADKFRYLSRKSSAEPGRWRTDRTPFLRSIMDEMSLFTPTKKVVIMKGSQCGVTESAINSAGWAIMNDPSPILVILPTEQLAKKIATSKFESMVDASPELAKLVGKSAENPLGGKAEKNSETILSKEFINGSIFFGSAASPNALSSISARLLIMDEADRFKSDVGGEGDPISLAANRCAAMSRHKIIILSTPTVAGESLIEKEFLESDQRFYFIPCPSCEFYQRLELKNFKFEIDEATKTANDAWFECMNCGDRIEENRKTWFLKKGEYRPTATGSCVGFHISQFYSPPGWRGWKELATIYHRATSRQDNSLLKAFYNTSLGLPWTEPTTRPEWTRIIESRSDRQPGKAHRDVLVITAGVDVQADRLELQLLGFTEVGHTHVIDYQIFSGDTSSNTPWIQLEGFLRKNVPSDIEGVHIPISICCIDTGYRTTQVYSFIRRFVPGRKVVGIKGRADLIVPVGRPSRTDTSYMTKGTDRRGIELFPVGVNVIKEKIYADIQARPDPTTGSLPTNYVHFPELPVEYFKQLTSEELRISYRKGREHKEWTLVHHRNESLDTMVYCWAGLYILGVHRYSAKQWAQLRDMLFPAEQLGEEVVLHDAAKPMPRKQKIKKSQFWGE